MKKRKELDALVSNGKLTHKRINCIKNGSGSCSAHELLRHDTDSSDMEDFSILQPRRKGRKKHGNHLCITSVCLSLCQFILVTSSVLISGALIYMHLGLREDIDLLRAHLQKVEAGNKNTPEALHVIHSSLKQLDSNVSVLYIDVRKNIADIENITSEVKHLKEVASSLRESIAAAPAIQQLPKDMHALSESVANFGSKMTALESNVKELKDQQSNLQTTAQNLSGELDVVKVTVQELSNSSESSSKSSVNTSGKDAKVQTAIQQANQHIDFLQGQLTNVMTSVNQLNASLSNQLTVNHELPSKLKTVNDAIVFLNNETQVQNTRLYSLENFLHTNITIRIDDLESEKRHNYQEIDEYLNKTLSEVVLRLINKEIFHTDPAKTLVQPIEKTHDMLVLLAALLRNYSLIPNNAILYDSNATEVVKAILHQAFKQISMEQNNTMETKVQNNKESITRFSAPANKPDLSSSTDLAGSANQEHQVIPNNTKIDSGGLQNGPDDNIWSSV
ncbi:EF-hand calcium-binding domain-containing protein 14 isoform X2 [Parasteatoda tepidariorum]|uniref:EF-hand calcium-binding domain-containing protein 14 isoform X2 n=2 Tax=Parasteatoda tepidariorum TaxID=114398 RepID=UPI00077FA7C5|nr:EF-hand calcium-binding domain-containing protein 14 isoform X2 [Parasteatoda tepidariorum]